MNIFGKNIKYLRKRAGLTQEKMAELLDVSITQYGNYEQGVNTPSMDKIVLLCDFFDIPLDYLFRKESKRFQGYAGSILFDELSKMDGEKADTMFYLLEKLLEYKSAKDESED